MGDAVTSYKFESTGHRCASTQRDEDKETEGQWKYRSSGWEDWNGVVKGFAAPETPNEVQRGISDPSEYDRKGAAPQRQHGDCRASTGQNEDEETEGQPKYRSSERESMERGGGRLA
ncbi:hypothetical protein LTR66_016322 [Elasticomyces elasticus]|nr:hypothetical protein LTR66_016322 [Elasticomyces elasticus]KAK5011627.1 hypothetical protein LTR28_011463 [Elasticomyces elasticus]